MNNKENVIAKKISKFLIGRVKLTPKIEAIHQKNNQQHKKYLDKVLALFNPLISKTNNYKNISYKIQKGSNLNFYQTNNKGNSNLILEVKFNRLVNNTSISVVNKPYMDVVFYKSKCNLKEKLESLSFIGEISKYLLKNESKISSKLVSFTNDFIKWKQPLIIKLNKLLKKDNELQNTSKNIHLPYFIKYLKEGITLNSSIPNIKPIPYSFDVDWEDRIENITKIQLLNDKEIKFTYLDDSNNLQTHSIFPEDNIQSFIKDEFLGKGLLPYIATPKVYPEFLKILNQQLKKL